MCSLSKEKDMYEEDLTKCSICFEQFKTPRCLPCLHTFCQDCLSSHISSECQAKENPVGFDCPLCRKFVPSPSLSLNFHEWCQCLPTNELLSKFSSWTESKRLCEACLRDNEEDEASSFCLACSEALCNNCTKYHRKSRASQYHKICPLDEIEGKNALEMSKMSTDVTCSKHKDRPIELYCNDHKEVCCAMCCSTDHRKCESVETIEQKAIGIRSSGSVDLLLRDLKNFEEKLSEAKNKQEKNITEIEDNADKMTEEVQSLKERIIQHIEKLESEFLDEMSTLTKQCKEKLTRNVQAVRDRIHLIKHCITDLEGAKGLQSSTFLTEFLKAKKTLDFVESKKTRVFCFTINSDLDANFKAITDLSKIGKTSVAETEQNIEGKPDVKSFKLKLCQHIEILGMGSRSLILLSSSEILIPDWKNTSMRKYCRDNATWNLQREIKFGHKTFDIKRKDNVLFVSCPDNSKIKVINSDDFKEIRTFNAGCRCLGLSIQNSFLYAACYDSVIKMDTEGKILKTYSTDRGVHFVVATKKGHIVHSNYNNSQVTAMTEGGDSAWKYSHPSLTFPYGLHVDSHDIIYVAGTDSNNVHVLSNEGSLLKIVENILRPVYFILNDERNFCCVGTKAENKWETDIKIYSIK